MMLPALLLVGVGKRRRFWIPLPAFLLWPFWLLGWVVWFVFKATGIRWEGSLRELLILVARLSGMRVDVESVDGSNVHLRII